VTRNKCPKLFKLMVHLLCPCNIAACTLEQGL